MTSEEMRAWLDGLKVGDEVAIRSGRDNVRIAKVTHLTPTQVVINCYRFRRDDGRKLGKSTGWYGRDEIVPIDAKVCERIARDNFRAEFSYYSELSAKLPIATVRKLLAVLAEAEQEGKENK